MYIPTQEEMQEIENHLLTRSLNATERKLFKEHARQVRAYEKGERTEPPSVELFLARNKIVEARTWLNIYLLHEMGRV